MRRSLVVLVVLAAAVGAAAPAAAQVQRAADGSRCTIVGTERADTLRGTRRDDVICGLGGNDRIFGGTGRDTIDGGAGADTVAGDDGMDLLLGGDGTDMLNGGASADRVVGGTGRDAVTATSADTCAAPGEDAVTGACTPDIAGPAISEIAIPAEAVPGTPLVVTWRVTDATGVGYLDGGPATYLFISGAPGWITWCGFPVPAEQVSGTSQDGRFRVSCPVPSAVPNGTYGIQIGAYDLGGAGTTIDDAGTFRIAAGSADQEAPLVTDVTRIGPVPGPGETLVLEYRAADPAGIAYVLPWVFGPNGHLTNAAGLQWFAMSEDPVLLSGDAMDGRYRVRLPAVPDLAAGTYQVWFSGRDTLGNRMYDGGPSGSGYISFVVPG